LKAAGQGSLVYFENQYFFDHGIISEIHAAAECLALRQAKALPVLQVSKPTWKRNRRRYYPKAPSAKPWSTP
jgi:hypothetical protein